MKTYFLYLKTFVTEHFDVRKYALVIIFLSISIWLNYHYDFEDSVLDRIDSFSLRTLAFALFQLFPFAVTILIFEKSLISSKKFWSTATVVFLIVGVLRSFRDRIHIVDIPRSVDRLIGTMSHRGFDLILVLTLLSIVYLVRDKKRIGHFYGLRKKNARFDVYLLAIVAMAVIIYISTFFTSIQDYYPVIKRYSIKSFSNFFDIPQWTSIVLFELTYLSSFIIVELLYRGLIIYKFEKVVGNHVVIAMASTYVFLHFGKPMPEAISSFFGGYILGIWSMKTENIWGGIIVHMGVAALMELISSIV